MIEALRNGTRAEHQELDQLLVPIIKRIRTHRDYIDLLAMFYGFMQPVQDRIDRCLNDGLVADYWLRRRPVRLLNDIMALTGYPEPTVLCQRLPAIRNVGEALGACYVLEGSTLGGPVICRMIKENLQITDGQGLSFFTGYGENNRKMWDGFVRSLEELALMLPDTTVTVESARNTFKCFKNWLIDAYARKGHGNPL